MRKRNRVITNPLVRQAVESGEYIPLVQWLRLHGMSRRTFYNRPEIPRVKDGWHVYVPRDAQVTK